MYIAHTALASWHHFPPQILKNMDLETVSHFATQNHRKSQKCVQSGSQEAPQIHPKIDKTGPLDLYVPFGCPPGPRDHQNGVPGTQKVASRSPK